MKKYIAYAAAIGLALPVSFALPAPANAGHDGAPAFCKVILDAGGLHTFPPNPPAPQVTLQFNNLGECVSFVNQRELSQVQICKAIKLLGFSNFGLKNFGDCMVNFEL